MSKGNSCFSLRRFRSTLQQSPLLLVIAALVTRSLHPTPFLSKLRHPERERAAFLREQHQLLHSLQATVSVVIIRRSR